MIKLHGNPLSNCTRRVVCVLYEKQIDFEWVTVDYVHDAHKSSEYVAKHPFGQIPYLEDDGFIVYESRAICQYLAAKYADQGTDLYPPAGDWEGLALLQQGISIEQSNFDPFVSKIFYEKVFKARKNIGTGRADPVRVAEYLATLESKLKAYESILSKQRYLTGDKISLGDLFHLPYATTLETLGLDEVYAKYPAFYAWLKGMQERDSWKRANVALAIDEEGVAYLK